MTDRWLCRSWKNGICERFYFIAICCLMLSPQSSGPLAQLRTMLNVWHEMSCVDSAIGSKLFVHKTRTVKFCQCWQYVAGAVLWWVCERILLKRNGITVHLPYGFIMLHVVPERPYSHAQAPVVISLSSQMHWVPGAHSEPLAQVTASEEWLMHSENS